jgi:[acyl-carrier-protein] S-malonyltransferase
MLPAQEKLREKLNNIKFNDPQVSIICNYTGLPENNPIILKNNIIEQVVNKVKWRETMNFLSNEKLQQLVELGSGKVLTNIAKRMSNQIHSFNIETLEDFKEKLSNFS